MTSNPVLLFHCYDKTAGPRKLMERRAYLGRKIRVFRLLLTQAKVLFRTLSPTLLFLENAALVLTNSN